MKELRETRTKESMREGPGKHRNLGSRKKCVYKDNIVSLQYCMGPLNVFIKRGLYKEILV